MKLDPARSRVSLFTFAEGLFSALAHDLELNVRDATGTADGETCELRLPAAGIAVTGAVKRGKLDRGVLSSNDRSSIERQIREEVFRGGTEVIARGTREGGRARIELTVPSGRATVSCAVDVTRSEKEASARGEVDLSMRALGLAPVKGPMGAFRLSDRVRVTFDLIFVAE